MIAWSRERVVAVAAWFPGRTGRRCPAAASPALHEAGTLPSGHRTRLRAADRSRLRTAARDLDGLRAGGPGAAGEPAAIEALHGGAGPLPLDLDRIATDDGAAGDAAGAGAGHLDRGRVATVVDSCGQLRDRVPGSKLIRPRLADSLKREVRQASAESGVRQINLCPLAQGDGSPLVRSGDRTLGRRRGQEKGESKRKHKEPEHGNTPPGRETVV